MNKFSLIVAATLAAFVLAIPQPADAKGPGWKTGGGHPSGFVKGKKKGWGTAGQPPGWSHGRKTGWQGADVPPGWKKKPAKQRRD